MTVEDLQATLANYVNDDVAETFLEAHRLLNALGSDDHDLELQNILSIEETDGTLLVGRIEATLTIAVVTQLTAYGITIIEGTPLTVSTLLLDGLANFERHQVFEATRWILSTDEYDDVEKLGEVLSLYIPLEVVDVTFYVEHVSPATMRRLKTVVNEALAALPDYDDETPSQPMLDDARERIRLLHTIERHMVGGRLTVVRTIADRGFVLGHENDAMLDMAVEGLDTIEDKAQLAMELLGYCVYAREDYLEDVTEFVKDYADGDHTQRVVLRTINQFLTEGGYTRAEA